MHFNSNFLQPPKSANVIRHHWMRLYNIVKYLWSSIVHIWYAIWYCLIVYYNCIIVVYTSKKGPTVDKLCWMGDPNKLLLLLLLSYTCMYIYIIECSQNSWLHRSIHMACSGVNTKAYDHSLIELLLYISRQGIMWIRKKSYNFNTADPEPKIFRIPSC